MKATADYADEGSEKANCTTADYTNDPPNTRNDAKGKRSKAISSALVTRMFIVNYLLQPDYPVLH